MMKKLIAIAVLFLSASVALAEGEIVGVGAGTSSCKSFIDFIKSSKGAEKDSAMMMFDSWMSGYVTGRNDQLHTLGYEWADLGKVHKLGNKLTQRCEQEIKNGNGKIIVMIVAEQMFDEMFGSNLKKR